MEEEEMLEQTNETENVDTQATEEFGEGIHLTDTTDEVEEYNETIEPEEKEEVKKNLRELLESDPEYQEEFNDMIKGRLDRQERKHQKELSKYKSAEEVLKAGLGATDIDDAENKLREFWSGQGIALPDKDIAGLTQEDREDQAVGKYERLQKEGFESMNDEANRLAAIGYQNLNETEKILFNKLCATLTKENNRKELLKLGAKEEVLSDKSFTDFRDKFNSNVPIKEIYEMYMKTKPKSKVENPGSMKSDSSRGDLKNFYTFEEASKFTAEDYERNPKLEEIVEKSMQKW